MKTLPVLLSLTLGLSAVAFAADETATVTFTPPAAPAVATPEAPAAASTGTVAHAKTRKAPRRPVGQPKRGAKAARSTPKHATRSHRAAHHKATKAAPATPAAETPAAPAQTADVGGLAHGLLI